MGDFCEEDGGEKSFIIAYWVGKLGPTRKKFK